MSPQAVRASAVRRSDTFTVDRFAFYFAFLSAAVLPFSIAISQIMLGASLACFLVRRSNLRLPRIWAPLATFMALTVISLAFSGDPWAGRPQIRKFFVYLMLLVVFSGFHRLEEVRTLTLVWAGAGGIAAIRGLVQFAIKLHESRRLGFPFYNTYIGQRITGFTDNWQTFGGELMIVIIMVAAFVMFSPSARRTRLWFSLGALLVISAALVLGFTRGVWLGTACAAVYLIWFWKRWLLLSIPLIFAVLLLYSPTSVRLRIESGYDPQQRVDSNQHRIVCWRTGWQMVKAHPWLGLGPEMVGRNFDRYVPADIPRPLPLGYYGHLHSIYIHYAAERGVAAALVIVWLLIQLLWDFWRALRRLPPGRSETRFILHGAIAVVLAVAVSGSFELNLGDSEVLAMFLSAVACGYVARAAVVAKEAPGA